MKTIDAEKLKAEVEKKIEKYIKLGEESDALQDGNAKYWGGVLSCLNEISSLVHSLEQEESDIIDMNYLQSWYQASIDETEEPIWTDKHLEELYNDFYLIPKRKINYETNR